MASEEKIVLVERLLEAKAITFREALKLLETEYVYQYWPYIQPYNPPIVTYDFNLSGSETTTVFELTNN